MINVALEEVGVPVLNFPVDAVDSNSWDQDRMWKLVGDFIEQRVAPAKAERRARTE
jgi:hypothetical protein